MDELDGLADECETALSALEELAKLVYAAPSIPEKKKAEVATRPAVREAKSKLSALRTEVRRSTEVTRKTIYERKCKEYDTKIKDTEKELRNQIYPPANAAPPAGVAATGKAGAGGKPAPSTYAEARATELMGVGGVDGSGFENAQQVLDTGIRINKDAIESLRRTERLQHVTEETGQETLGTLQKQTEQMYQIDEELQNLQGELDRASRDVKWFYRQLAGDKCFLSLFGICVVALAVLMCIMIYQKRKKSK